MPKYDVAVIGAGLGGLAAAALLSSKNKKTIVIEQGASLSDALGVVEKDGFIFSAIPPLSYGFEAGGALQEFTAHLGIVQHTAALSPCYQVALPDRRITVFTERNETLEELKREFPKEISSLVKFYDDLGKLRVKAVKNRFSAYLAKRRSAAGFMSSYRFSRELTAFFDIQALYFFQKTTADLSLDSFLTLCDTPPRRVHGGFRKLGDQLYGVLLRHGGEVRYNEPLPELVSRENRIIGVKTAQSLIEADIVILNTLLPQHRSLLFVGLHEEVIPVSMCQDVLFLPDYSRLHEVLGFSLNMNDEDTLAPKGMKTLTVSFGMDRAADKQMLVEKLGRLIPFMTDYQVFAEEFEPNAGHAVLPADITVKPLRSRTGVPLFHRTSSKNLFVLHDQPESPLQVISAVRRFVEKLD